MPKFLVTVENTVVKVYEVEAEDEEHANELTMSGEYDNEVDTDYKDFEVQSITLVEESEK